MEDTLISFETAKLAKEKGYKNHDCKKYSSDGLKAIYGFVSNPTAAPTQSLLQKWLREVHNIIVEVLVFDKGFLEKDKFCFQWRVYNKTEDWFTGFEYKTYEEALEAGLQEALKLIK